jgi:hypothetical protein
VSVRTDIEDAVRAWLVAAGADGGISSPDAKVIIADQDAARPPLPYVTVKVLVYDVQEKEDETWVDEDGNRNVRGLRTGTVSLNAYGATAEGWLERAHLLLGMPSVLAILNGIALRPRPGGINNLSGVLDGATQARFQRDYAVDYERESSATEVEAATELERVVTTLEVSSDVSSTYTETITEAL